MIGKIFDKPSSVAIAVTVVAVAIAGLALIFSSNGIMPAYTGDEMEPAAEPAPENILPTETYASGKDSFVIEVPAGWIHIVKDGHDTFVQDDGTMLQLQVMPYDPSANMVTPETIAQDTASAGGQLKDFAKLTASSYMVSYAIGDAAYIEHSVWDRSAFIRIMFVMDAARYEYYYDTCMHIIDSFVWKPADPIPDGFRLFYSGLGDFEFGVPLWWECGVSPEGVVIAADNETGAAIYAAASQTPDGFHGIAQMDYVNAMGRGRAGFILRSFSNDGETIAAEASYNAGGVPWVLRQYRVANGQFQYAFSLECPEDAYGDAAGLFSMAVSLFRFG